MKRLVMCASFLFFTTTVSAVLPPSGRNLIEDFPDGVIPARIFELYNITREKRAENKGDMVIITCERMIGRYLEKYKLYFEPKMFVLEDISVVRIIIYPITLAGTVVVEAIRVELSERVWERLPTSVAGEEIRSRLLRQAQENPARLQRWLVETTEELFLPCVRQGLQTATPNPTPP